MIRIGCSLLGQHFVVSVIPFLMLILALKCCLRVGQADYSRRRQTLCIVDKRSVLEQKLLLTAYRKPYTMKSIGTNDLCLEVMSTIESHSPMNISETVTDRRFVQKNHQQEMTYGNKMVT